MKKQRKWIQWFVGLASIGALVYTTGVLQSQDEQSRSLQPEHSINHVDREMMSETDYVETEEEYHKSLDRQIDLRFFEDDEDRYEDDDDDDHELKEPEQQSRTRRPHALSRPS